MTTVHVKPMPEAIRRIKNKIFRPMHPPVFMEIGPGGVTPQDTELARELFKILDEESQDWYGRRGIFEGL